MRSPPAHETLHFQDLEVELVRKRIIHIHIRILPPEGRIRVSAPLHLSQEAVRQALLGRMDWMRKKQALLRGREKPADLKFETGETHWFEGQAYRLELVEGAGLRPAIHAADGTLVLKVRPGSTTAVRGKALEDWYRQRLKERIPELLAQWEPIVGASPAEWGVKRMKTRWGTCNVGARRIWLNLELIKKSRDCQEYVLVHELVHLLERGHGPRFKALMDRFLPDWRLRRKRLGGGA